MNILKTRSELLRGKTIYDLSINVCFYARVSTDKNDQLNSLENQSSYFKEMIDSNKTWTFVDGYIDEGISGTSAKNRTNFLKMIEDSKNGKIDLILTKEVSRFARNIVDSINYTEELLNNGTVVYFLSDNINTIFSDSEFRLALMSSLAQDEVRKLSERVKFGIKRSIKSGRVLGSNNITGYHKKDGRLIIDEDKRKMIEILYNLYSTGNYSFTKISHILQEKGYLNTKGTKYSDTTLKKIILNPKYKGYYTANLSYVENYKTHKKVYNPKEKWIIYKDYDKCPPIVSEELWDMANKIYNINHSENIYQNKPEYNSIYTNKIYCGEHKSHFVRYAHGKRKNNPTWQCKKYIDKGLIGCESPIIKESTLNEIILNELKLILNNYKINIGGMVNTYQVIFDKCFNSKIFELNKKNNELEIMKDNLLDLRLKNSINENDYILKNSKLKNEQELNYKKLTDIKKMKFDYQKHYKELSKIISIDLNFKMYVNIFLSKIFVNKVDKRRGKINLKIEYYDSIYNKNIEVLI